MMHWKYLKYILRHKWYVFLACLKMRVPLWRAIIHDWQKFTPTEWTPYVQSFYGPWDYDNRPAWLVDAFDRAWLHHQHYGPHHWQFWLLREDSGATKALEMPETYVREMLADWVGAGQAITGENNLHKWYIANKEKIVLHPRTRAQLTALMFTHYGLPKAADWPEGEWAG